MATRVSTENITFESDGYQLEGILHLPDGIRPPVVIGSHGLLADSTSPKQVALASACTERGLAFFRFDYRGCGRSEGLFQEVNSLEGRCRDLINAISLLKDRSDLGPNFSLFGSSFGGTVSLKVALELDICAIVTFAAPIRYRRIGKLSPTQRPEVPGKKEDLPISIDFDISRCLGHHHHIFIIHGEDDQIVPVTDAVTLHDKSKRPKKLWIQKKGDHKMSLKTHQKDFVSVVSKWFDEFGGRRT